MANKLIRIGFTQVIPANPGRPPTPPRTVTVTNPVSSALPSAGGGSGGSGGSGGGFGSGGSWVLSTYTGNGDMGYGTDKYVWVPEGGIVPGTGVQIS